MFVLSVGLLGVAALIPVGRFAIVETAKADRSGACGRAALSEIKVRRMLEYGYWSDATPAQTNQAFAIDPLGVASGLNTPLGGAGGPIARITLRSFPGPGGNLLTPAEAERIFMWHDDLQFSLPEDIKPRPADESDRPRADLDVLGVPQFAGHYSWLVTVTPAAAEASLPVAEKTLYAVSVVVCYRRDFSAEGEHTAGVKKFPGSGWGGGSVQLSQVIDVKRNEWIMLCGGGHCKWYRVVSAGELLVDASSGDPDPNGTPVTVLSLAGPDCPVAWMIDSNGDGLLDAQAVVIDSVVGVYTGTVELDRD